MDQGYFSDTTFKPLAHNLYQLRDDLYYTWQAEGYMRRIKVPKGFIFDGASIPMVGTFITWVLPWYETIYPMGAHWRADCFHDWNWMYRGRVPVGTYDLFVDGKWVDIGEVIKLENGQAWTFDSSNRLYGRMLKEDGIGKKERNTMQWAVGTPIGKMNWNKGKLPDDARQAA